VARGVNEESLAQAIRKHFRLTPRGIIESLNLRRPIYRETARHGHFGRDASLFSWEATDKADLLRRELGKAVA
jgi:S-adenosylmethionine synthetase